MSQLSIGRIDARVPFFARGAWPITLYFLKRLGWLLLVLWGVITLLFVLSRGAGDPAALFSPPEATAEQIEETRRRMGLDQPVLIQYVATVLGAFRFDFGDSFAYQQDAFGIVISRFAPSLAVIVPALIIGVVLAFALGIYAALRSAKMRGRALMTAAFVVDGIPYFLLALMLILIFGVWLQVLPATGSEGWQSRVLPIAVLATGAVATLARLVRGQMIDVFSAGSVQTARSKGASPRSIIFRHALPLALPPLIAYIGILFSVMFGSLLILEPIFNYSGIGALLVRSVTTRDFTMVQAAVFLIALLVTIVNMVADAVVRLIDPRLRAEVTS
ncbi:ABC transporter permease [Microbacterium sp. A82]|uniref:ABC transporter permease n=1 Tax=Microbacterium sp. A82 TaxID=3450452 RepID=UPI003F30DAC5